MHPDIYVKMEIYLVRTVKVELELLVTLPLIWGSGEI